MVLCKCNPQTADKLLKASSNVQRLYLLYPEPVLSAIFIQSSAPVGALFQISWALHSMQNDDFDLTTAQDLLETGNIFAWNSKLPRARPSMSDQLEVLQVLLDFYMEVHDAADLFGQCMVAGVDKFLDPTVQSPATTLSGTEHSRITCALWVLRIFDQLRSEPYISTLEHRSHFTSAFVGNLEIWQIDQVASLGRKFGMSEDPLNDAFEFDLPTEAGPLGRLLESAYVRNVAKVSFFQAFPFAVRCRWYEVNANRLNTKVEAGCDSELSIAIQFKDHVSTTKELGLTRTRTRRYGNLCWHLGLHFWDYERLANWRITDADDLLAASDNAHATDMSLDFSEDEALLEHRSATQRNKEQQIIEWTRGPGIDTLEDWLHQRTTALRFEQGEGPFPRRFIWPGARCSGCGLDGHWHGRCHPRSWQID